jgi:PHD/YefM family antitoxin component YafN of YafNO toxin-antitoxin module
MPVVSTPREAKEQFLDHLARFRKEGPQAAPVVMGSRRRPEAVLVSYERYQAMERELTGAEAWIARARADAEALASVRVEGLEPDGFGHAVAQRVVEGELTDDEAIAELDKHFGHPRARE